VGLLFDAELGHRDVGLLAAGTAFFIIAMSLAQALIAVERPARMAAGWVAGVAAFVVVAALGDDLMLRVQLAAVSGSLTAAVAMAVSLLARLRQIDPALLVRGTVPAPVPEFGVTAPLDQDRSATQRTDWPKGGRRRRSLQRTKGTASRS
jgi:hypothetical protein